MENWETKYSSKLPFSDNGCDLYDDWPICFLFLLVIVSLAIVRVQNIYNISENNHSWERCVAEQIMLFGQSVPGLSRLHWWEIWHLVTVHNFRISLFVWKQYRQWIWTQGEAVTVTENIPWNNCFGLYDMPFSASLASARSWEYLRKLSPFCPAINSIRFLRLLSAIAVLKLLCF